MEIISRDVGKCYKIKKGLFKTYNVDVLKDFNYVIKQGEIIGVLGLSGAGKSTIVNLLSGRIKPTFGQILVDGEEDYKKLQNNCEIISDFNEKRLLNNHSVYDNLIYFGAKYKLNEFDVEKHISTYREIFELDKILNKKVSELDYLGLIKVNITISMLKKASVLFFDSALTTLGVIERNLVLKMLKRLNKEYRTTIVVSSNDLLDIEKICKRLTIVKEGKIIEDGEFDYLKNKLWNKKIISIVFNKSYVAPKGEFEIIESSDYLLRLKVDFKMCDFASVINQFDINNIVDINISSISLNDLYN